MTRDVTATYRKAAADYLAAHGGKLLASRAGDAGQPQWSDAWLLLAIRTARGRATGVALEDIMAAGDGLNHAIFTAEEINGGFRRLERAGLLTIDGTECRLTDAFADAWNAAGAEKRSTNQQYEFLRKLLGAPSWPPPPSAE